MAGLAACETGRSSESIDYESDIQPLWEESCACHLSMAGIAAEAAGRTDLLLNRDSSYAMLVERQSEGIPSMNRIEPRDLESSYLWLKIQGTHRAVGGEGDQMPPALAMKPEHLERIEAWIQGL